MSENRSAVSVARNTVARCREAGDPRRLAEALESLASASTREVDLLGSAAALEEAADLWSTLGAPERQGSCLLLAASTRRLAGDPKGARRDLELGLAAELPPRIKKGFEAEWCEQELANGRAESAYQGFTRLLASVTDELEPVQRAQLYQRRAAAATAGQQHPQAADDFLRSAVILREQGYHADAEASTLAAAAVLSDAEPELAECVVAAVLQNVPTDGAAAARRGLVGGRIAMRAGRPIVALERFDAARQGALDVGDLLSYHVAAVEAAHAAEALGDFETAYARLATAWASLSDTLGREAAAQMIRPELQGLRERLGADSFAAAKRKYETGRRSV